ncbi:MAG: SpoIID/LytB domain-containing protein [Gemmatimonadota bacterium]|nr:SpoIID/LytB domain-containing protein [Gemmatimonadota bacterium]
MRSAPRWRSTTALLLPVVWAACAPARTTLPPEPTPAPAPVPPVVEAPAPAVPAAPTVRVGLLVDTTEVELTSSAGFALVDAGTGAVLGRAGAGDRWRALPGSGGGVRVSGDGFVGGSRGAVLVRPEEGGTVSAGGVAYRGAMLLQPTPRGRLTAVNVLDMETYLLGVVPREIGRVGPELLEAAKAQAVAARTYAVRYLGRREALGFDVFATTQDQVYGGVPAEHEPVSRAVRATAGEVLTYAGEPIEAFYHSTCAGHTAAIEEVWNEAPRPYLKSVVDVNPRTGIAYDSVSSRFRWTERWPAAALASTLSRTLADSLPRGVRSIGEIRDMRVTQRTPSGRVRALRITTSEAGTLTVGGDRIRWILPTAAGAPLNSSRFDVELVRDTGGRVAEVVAAGGGWGHGIGMCQVGAMGRARDGQDYRTILRTYYGGTEIRKLY